jgi:tetratricopeptide (TPR) repeat protein
MFERGLFSEAEPLLNLARDALPESTENLTVATLSFNLAGIRNECNRIAEARELCECTMKIREKMLAHDDPLLGNTYYSMGIVYMEDGQLEKALEYIKRAVKIHENCPEHDHSPTAFSYGNLGLCYLRMGKLNEASICMEKSEVLWRNSCGVDSDRYAT